uniref:General control protein GCN4 n=1 Tax=Anthurium amnicola TaxID=1678845 RepID=A0A1D1Y6D5_9ARAE
MVSTPKTSNKVPSPRDDSNKVNMSQYPGFVQCVDPASTGSPQAKSGTYDSSAFYELYDLITGNDILVNDLFHSETSTYDFSPELNSSMTTPSLILDSISTPRDLNDSPIFNNAFISSPIEPAIDFFPDLSNDPTASSSTTRNLMQISSVPSVPSVTIPVDDPPLNNISALSPALNIPWSTDITNSSSTDNMHTSSNSLSNYSVVSSPSSTAVSSAATSPLTTSIRARNRKRSANELDKDPQLMADELALKRAKNTDAARRSRLRKAKKMEGLEKEVNELKTENIDLQTRIAVLESEKKGLESKNAEKESRVKMLEQQLAEAHERLIKRT